MSGHPDENIVCLAKALTAPQAHIWQNALEDEGIHCKVVGDFLEGGLGNIPGLGSELWVHENDVERAKQILEQHQDFAQDAAEEQEEEEEE